MNTSISEGLRFEITTPAKLSEARWDEIQDIRRRYYLGVLAGKRQLDVTSLVLKTTRDKWDNPNNAVGSEFTRAGQAFSHARVVASYTEHNELAGFVYAVDNASSSRGRGAGLERFAKLHAPLKMFREARYRVLRETVLPGETHTATAAALMLATAAHDAKDRTVNAYPLRQESNMLQLLALRGSMRVVEDYDPVFVLPSEDARTANPAQMIKLQVPHADMFVEGLVGGPDTALHQKMLGIR